MHGDSEHLGSDANGITSFGAELAWGRRAMRCCRWWQCHWARCHSAYYRAVGSAYVPPLVWHQHLIVGGRIGREQVQMLAASEVALIVLGCIAAELIAALGAERAVVSKVLPLVAVLLGSS